MLSLLRALIATLTGSLVAIVLAHLGAIVVVLVTIGIPLGAEGGDPSPGQYAALLLMAACAAAVGGHIAAGIAREHRPATLIAMAALLAAGTLYGFTRPVSQWPVWWAPALAAVLSTGIWIGGTITRRSPASPPSRT